MAKVFMGLVMLLFVSGMLYATVSLVASIVSARRGVSRKEAARLIDENRRMKNLLNDVARDSVGVASESLALEAEALLNDFDRKRVEELEK